MKKLLIKYVTLVYLVAFLSGCSNSSENNQNINDSNVQESQQMDVYDETASVTTTDIQTEEQTKTGTTTITVEQTTSEITTTTELTTQTTVTTQTTTEAVQPVMAEVTTSISDNGDLELIQKNSIAWLNYLAMLSQEINSSKNSKMYLEEAYAALINNTNPANVNELTESHLVSLLDSIEKYRMIAVKRERLQYIYEQNKAKAIKEAVPNPVALLSTAHSFDLKGLVLSVAYMAVDSYSSYSAYNAEIDQEYLKDGWELDDEEAENLHDSRKRAFTYMIDIVRQDNLPGELALNENAITKFVECKNNTNTHQQIQFLESEKETYKFFGSYWLLLAECYYKNNDYRKCLASVEEYENLHSDIFRKDYYLAKTLPLAIVSASEIQPKDKYVETAEKYLEMIIDNTENSEWSLRYFAAEMYIDLYSKTQKERYLRSAYNLALNNVNFLANKQNEINSTYLSAVKEVSIPKDATRKEKNQIKDYNKSLKEKRKTELPEVYEPLALNCDLLFSVADKISLSKSDKQRIDGILSGTDNSVFLTEPVKNLFMFESTDINIDSEYDKDKLILPVSCVSDGAIIKVTVSSSGQTFVYDDWTVDKVNRPSDDFSSFTAVYTSKAAKKCEYNADSTVKVEITNGEYSNSKPLTLNFKVCNYKEKKFVIPATFDFEQVK